MNFHFIFSLSRFLINATKLRGNNVKLGLFTEYDSQRPTISRSQLQLHWNATRRDALRITLL